MMNCSGIYLIKSPSGSGYIGSSVKLQTRKTRHFYHLKRKDHHCDGLQNAFDKYSDELIFIVIEYCSTDILIEREQFWIDNFKILISGMLYNSSKIAGRPELNEQATNKIREKATGRKQSFETIQKRLKANAGFKHSEKVVSDMRNRKISEEHKRKISLKNKGLKRKQDSRAHLHMERVNWLFPVIASNRDLFA